MEIIAFLLGPSKHLQASKGKKATGENQNKKSPESRSKYIMYLLCSFLSSNHLFCNLYQFSQVIELYLKHFFFAANNFCLFPQSHEVCIL